jgi:hypothetical protein
MMMLNWGQQAGTLMTHTHRRTLLAFKVPDGRLEVLMVNTVARQHLGYPVMILGPALLLCLCHAVCSMLS